MIPDAAVEAAAKASFERANPSYVWADVELHWRAAYVENQRAALEAAAPHLMAQALESAAHAFGASVPEGEYSSTPTQVIDWLREYADAYRAAK